MTLLLRAELEKLIKDETKPSISPWNDGWNNALFMVLQAAESGTFTAQAGDGWFLSRNHVNNLVAESLDDLIRRAKWCSICDVDLRENGKNVRFQADWIKYMEPARTPSTGMVGDGWIPVSERLPEYGGSYLCLLSDEEHRILTWVAAYWAAGPYTIDEVTHWQPLPQPPSRPTEVEGESQEFAKQFDPEFGGLS